MNDLEHQQEKAQEKSFVWTKHNYLDVYNSKKEIDKLYNKYKLNFLEKNNVEFEIYLKGLTNSIDKEILLKEMQQEVEESERYKQLISRIRRVNKYKATAFERIIFPMYEELFGKQNPEQSFANILDALDIELKRMNETHFEILEDFEILNSQEKKHFKFYTLFKFFNVGIPLDEDKKFKTICSFSKFGTIDKKFFNDDKKHMFHLKLNFPIFQTKNKEYCFFFKTNNEIKMEKQKHFDKIVKKYYGDIKIIKSYIIECSTKELIKLMYKNSKFLQQLKKKQILDEYKLKPLLQEFNLKQRPDIWAYNELKKEIVIVEAKFYEHSEFKTKDVKKTISYMIRFNKYCELNSIKTRIKNFKIVYLSNSISEETLKEIEELQKKCSSYNLNFELIKFSELYNQLKSKPKRIKVFKDKYETKRVIDYVSNNKGVCIDLLEVTK